MTVHFADRLMEAIERTRAPAVVALDPVAARLPAAIRAAHGLRDASDRSAVAGALADFCRQVIDAVAALVPAVKVNSAFFEPYRAPGIAAYEAVIEHAGRRGLLVIGDVKRGDVGHSAEQYAQAHLGDAEPSEANPPATPDAITISGYFGVDGARPFIDAACVAGRGVFVLVRTSNPSAAAIQDVPTDDGRRMHDVIAEQVALWAADPGTIGSRGYSAVGAVVATRNAADAARLRAAMPNSIFLVPGYGAQGATADDLRPCFRQDGTGAIVAAGRSIIYAGEHATDDHAWTASVSAACEAFVLDLRRATGWA